MHMLKRSFISEIIVLGLFFGVTTSTIASEKQPFEAWVVNPSNPNEAWRVSQLDPDTNAIADLLEAQEIVSAAELDEINDFIHGTEILAEQGNISAQVSLALMYENNEIVPQKYHLPQDYHQAFIWYEKAANQGDVAAQAKLGLMYYEGMGVRQNYAMARKLVLKAANQGDPDAQGLIAEMYEEGRGVRPDKVQAKEWYGKACDNGDQYGCDRYRALNEKMYVKP